MENLKWRNESIFLSGRHILLVCFFSSLTRGRRGGKSIRRPISLSKQQRGKSKASAGGHRTLFYGGTGPVGCCWAHGGRSTGRSPREAWGPGHTYRCLFGLDSHDDSRDSAMGKPMQNNDHPYHRICWILGLPWSRPIVLLILRVAVNFS